MCLTDESLDALESTGGPVGDVEVAIGEFELLGGPILVPFSIFASTGKAEGSSVKS